MKRHHRLDTYFLLYPSLSSENDYIPLISSHKNLHSQVSLSTINPIFKESALSLMGSDHDCIFNTPF